MHAESMGKSCQRKATDVDGRSMVGGRTIDVTYTVYEPQRLGGASRARTWLDSELASPESSGRQLWTSGSTA